MTPKLIEAGGGTQGIREVPVEVEEFLIGRGEDCNLRLRDANISRHHCIIRVRAHELTLVDLGSSNGTYLNGNRVVSQAELRVGDEIRIGEFRFLLDLGEGTARAGLPEVDPLAHTMKVSKKKDV